MQPYKNQSDWDNAQPDDSAEARDDYITEQVERLLNMQDADDVSANNFIDALSENLGDLENWSNERPMTQVFLLAAQGKLEAAEKLATIYRDRAVSVAENMIKRSL